MNHITTRFAPSPTGYIHVGAVRTALFAWLLARQQQKNGRFILRIEDTDKVREVTGAEQHIIHGLHWLGIEWDEGPDIGGPQAPYRQSERLSLYKEWAKKLISTGHAYADPYTPQDIASFRAEAKKQKRPFLYRDHRPTHPPTWDETQPLRFKSSPKPYSWHDEVLGDLHAGEDAIDDFILIKSDGYPTYNFCHIIDDYCMGVTHIFRSQEFIASVPKFLNLYEALGFERPIFATLPYVMAMDGSKKLSKRDGAKDILTYQKEGYLPEAMMNFLATLGWNDGSEKEVFSVEDLIASFSCERVQKSPARFDEKRLLWINGQWIRRIVLDDFVERVQPFLPDSARNYPIEYVHRVISLVQERCKTLADISMLTNSFFEEPPINWELIRTNKQLKNFTKSELNALIQEVANATDATDFSEEALTEALNASLSATAQKPAVLFGVVRIALTWSAFSPGLAESMAILGKTKVATRLKSFIDYTPA